MFSDFTILLLSERERALHFKQVKKAAIAFGCAKCISILIIGWITIVLFTDAKLSTSWGGIGLFVLFAIGVLSVYMGVSITEDEECKLESIKNTLDDPLDIDVEVMEKDPEGKALLTRFKGHFNASVQFIEMYKSTRNPIVVYFRLYHLYPERNDPRAFIEDIVYGQGFSPEIVNRGSDGTAIYSGGNSHSMRQCLIDMMLYIQMHHPRSNTTV